MFCSGWLARANAGSILESRILSFSIPDLNLPKPAESDRPRGQQFFRAHAAYGRGAPASNPKVVGMTDSFSRAGQDRCSRALQV